MLFSSEAGIRFNEKTGPWAAPRPGERHAPASGAETVCMLVRRKKQTVLTATENATQGTPISKHKHAVAAPGHDRNQAQTERALVGAVLVATTTSDAISTAGADRTAVAQFARWPSTQGVT